MVHYNCMVICFDATTEAKRALDALLATGQFQDTSEVVSMALVNYDVLQRSHVRTGAPAAPAPVRIEKSVAPTNPSPAMATRKSSTLGPQIPDLLFLIPGNASGIKLATIETGTGEASSNLPPAQWLFGQYNKFLPAKVSCRGLLNLLRQKSGSVSLVDAAEAIADAAWLFGDYLYMLDQASRRPREDSFAAAFPISAGNGAVSRMRFANQFVGDLRQPKPAEGRPKETKFNGLPAALKFFVCADGKIPILELTTAGAEFALLQNPILDCGQPTPDRKFSDAEVEFLLSHIRQFVPEEASAYAAITDAINQEADTPGLVDEFLCERFNLKIVPKAEQPDQITQTFLTTQRTGAISRMADLGLLVREKTGLNVRYRVTALGKQFNL
jgi:hypothetical protein